jgi:hypothetical protein
MVYGMDTGQLESPADRYGQGSRFYKNTKRVLKVMAYFIYFLLVLTSAVASKGSFLLMTQSLGNPKQVCGPTMRVVIFFYRFDYFLLLNSRIGNMRVDGQCS